LKSAGVKEDTKFNHIHFEGLDKDITSVKYAASIPLDVYNKSDVLIAYLPFK
jgi:hypothetical protein